MFFINNLIGGIATYLIISTKTKNLNETKNDFFMCNNSELSPFVSPRALKQALQNFNNVHTS